MKKLLLEWDRNLDTSLSRKTTWALPFFDYFLRKSKSYIDVDMDNIGIEIKIDSSTLTFLQTMLVYQNNCSNLATFLGQELGEGDN
jgi:hypothetical protein